MRHGSSARFGVFTGDGQDLCDLLGGELARGATPGPIAQQPLDLARQCGRLLAAFDQDQSLERLGPAAPPGAYRMTFTPDLPGDILVGEAVEGQKNHPRPPGDGLGTGAGTDHRLKDGLLSFGDDELACPPWHCSDSRCPFEKVGALEDRRKAVPVVED
jgi:hypothetical protein